MKFKTIHNHLVNTVQRYRDFLHPEDLEYAERYIAKAVELYEAGLFTASRLLFMKWFEFNFRYGVKSMIGFWGEVSTCGIFNKTQTNTNRLSKFRFAPPVRKMELGG